MVIPIQWVTACIPTPPYSWLSPWSFGGAPGRALHAALTVKLQILPTLVHLPAFFSRFSSSFFSDVTVEISIVIAICPTVGLC